EPGFEKLFVKQADSEREAWNRASDRLSLLSALLSEHAPELFGKLPSGSLDDYTPKERGAQCCEVLGILLARKKEDGERSEVHTDAEWKALTGYSKNWFIGMKKKLIAAGKAKKVDRTRTEIQSEAIAPYLLANRKKRR